MIISEKQIYELINVARAVSLRIILSESFINEVVYLIYEIEKQQSEELKVIE